MNFRPHYSCQPFFFLQHIYYFMGTNHCCLLERYSDLVAGGAVSCCSVVKGKVL